MALFKFAIPAGAPVGQGVSLAFMEILTDPETLRFGKDSLNTTMSAGVSAVLSGQNFALQLTEGDISFPSGKVTSLTLMIEGVTAMNVTGLNLALGPFADFIRDDDESGLIGWLLSGNDRMILTSQSDNMTGGGGDDTLLGNGAADSLAGGTGHDSILGGAGNDRLFGQQGNDHLLGGKGNDFLHGDAGNDRLSGNAGADILLGAAGKDTLTGGAGADKFMFISAAAGNKADVISDFTSGNDQIIIDPGAFAMPEGVLPANAFRKGTAAQDLDDRFIYDKATGRLFFDVDGSGNDPAILLATLTNKPNLVASDIVIDILV
ncbi:calcium-binding protein [Neogemmobacter tilapiae]|uniref:Peptidase M10 serralysin C-terminal domain-containing protein n=1 Tax=Neogemmobacter tilapiae TaxID=875041 RepID=A0A918TJQ9_9RHOB|nr:calcium-binding protein [Gemmobacter tilapiae]GHC48832.1 hypothetical protein GCM10007315_08620 [Gemmobacter tilapiae]